LYLNNCLGEWMGYSNEELIEMGFEKRMQLIHPDDRQLLLQFIEQLISDNTPGVSTIEYRVSTRNKEIVWIRNRTRIFRTNSEGKPTHTLNVLQDITTEKSIHNQLDLQNRIFGYGEEIANLGTWTWNPDTNE